MAQQTSIEWCDHTFNPWVGCTKVSPGCDHCYAEGWAKRSGQVVWGAHAERRRTKPANWAQPLKWAKAAASLERRPMVFCASLADVFDNQVPQAWRDDLFDLVEATPELVWLFLTKRAQNILKMTDRRMPSNIAFGASMCVPDEVYRNAVALERAADRHLPAGLFVSAEPLLGDIAEGLRPHLSKPGHGGIEWVIAGGESGPEARPMHHDWARHLNDVTGEGGARFLFKQWGEWMPVAELRRLPDGQGPGFGAYDHCRFDMSNDTVRVGKKMSGRLLDGRLHDDRPVW